MSTKGQSLKEALSSMFATSVILICLLAGWAIWSFVMGNPVNFEGGNIHGKGLPGNYLSRGFHCTSSYCCNSYNVNFLFRKIDFTFSRSW